MLWIDGLPFADDGCPLHDIAQLADIAGPVVGQEKDHGIFGNLRGGIGMLPGNLFKQMNAQNTDILRTAPEGRYCQADDIQPVVQV